MNIFAIDLGNRRVKMKSDRGEYSYPASYLDASHIGTRSLAGISDRTNNSYQIEEEARKFVWGENLEIYNLPEKMISSYGRSERMKQKKAQRLLKFALAKLATDYKEARGNPFKVHVMLGVPITDLHKDSETVETLKGLLIGRHHIQVDSECFVIEIPSEEYISIVPQYMGTVLELAFDESLNRVDTFAQGRIGVIDIGGGTILINSANRMTPSPLGFERFEGIEMVIQDVANKVNSTKHFLIEQLLRSKDANGDYIYSPNHYAADARDITDIVEQSIDSYTRFTIAPLVTGSFPDLEEIDLIVMSGGGSSLISKDALLDEIGENYFSRIIFAEDSEKANVKGFYKGASLIWDNSSEYLMNDVEVEI